MASAGPPASDGCAAQSGCSTGGMDEAAHRRHGAPAPRGADAIAGIAANLARVLHAPLRAMSNDPIRVLAIGASTGGIHALNSFFEALPRRIGVPILVTQHLPAPFMPVFARQLGIAAKREALVAEEGMTLLADRVIIAPGDAHLLIIDGPSGPVVHLDSSASSSGCLPSLDPMFQRPQPLS